MYFNLISLFAVIRWHSRTVQMNMNGIEGGIEEWRRGGRRGGRSGGTCQEQPIE